MLFLSYISKMIMEVMKDTLKSKFTIEVAWDKTIDIL